MVTGAPNVRLIRVTGSVIVSAAVSVTILVSAWTVESNLGAPLFWTWLLTGLQVLSLWAAGRHHWWGWLLGAAVQPPWIVYAVLTGQLGFIPGCTISATVQFRSFLHQTRAPSPWPQRRRGIAYGIRRCERVIQQHWDAPRCIGLSHIGRHIRQKAGSY